MEIKLPIYKDGKIEKTYVANEVNLPFGVVDDVIALIDTEKFASATDDNALIAEASKVIVGAFAQVKTVLRELYPEITDDELKRAHLKDVALVIVNAFKFGFAEILTLATSKSKN